MLFPISLPLYLYLNLVPFMRYQHLFPKILRGQVTLKCTPILQNFNMCNGSTLYVQSANQI